MFLKLQSISQGRPSLSSRNRSPPPDHPFYRKSSHLEGNIVVSTVAGRKTITPSHLHFTGPILILEIRLVGSGVPRFEELDSTCRVPLRSLPAAFENSIKSRSEYAVSHGR